MSVSEERPSAASFEELALPLFDQLYNFAHWLTQDRSEAEDLVQETYTKALRGFSSFQAGTNFRAWMYRILRNSFLNSRTGLKTTVVLVDETLDNSKVEISTPETLLLAQCERQMVQEELRGLAVPFREILLLCEVEEMSYREISETLAVPIGTVMSRLSRARQALRSAVCKRIEGGRRGL